MQLPSSDNGDEVDPWTVLNVGPRILGWITIYVRLSSKG